MVVAFLTIRVKSLDEDNWGKLKWVLRYPKGARELKLMLIVKVLGVILWYVNALYAIYVDSKGHSDATDTWKGGCH